MHRLTLIVIATVLARPAASEPHVAFATSAKGNGNLGSWTDALASGATGLAAADAICASRAAAVGLPEADDFVAWLSDRDNDAFCRVLGLSGKTQNNCDQSGPLPDAGPWLRTDGRPFAESLSRLVGANAVLLPLLRDESGAEISDTFVAFSSTTRLGTLNTAFDDSPDCNRWTSGGQLPQTAPLAWLSGTGKAWTDSDGGASCDVQARLICLQRGTADVLPSSAPTSSKVAFASAQNVSGALGGVTGADQLCRQWASDAGLEDADSFKALIASATDAQTFSHRFEFDGPWRRLDGVEFASSLAQMQDGAVAAPLNVDQFGNYLTDAIAWTGTTQAGVPIGLDCANWSDADSSLGNGSVVNWAFLPFNHHNWLATAQISCSLDTHWGAKLYCLLDGPLLFRSGFD